MVKFFVIGLLFVLGAPTTLAAVTGGPGWWVLRRRLGHDEVRSYAEMFHHLEPGQLLAEAPEGRWARDWAQADPDRSSI